MTIARSTLADARRDRLYFAQVREDPCLELAALHPGPDDHVVVVGSGGCTALSLLAAGAGQVTAVDLNATQHDLVELKALAVATLPAAEAIAFLGAAPDTRRLAHYATLRPRLGESARAYWDARPAAVRDGVLHAGVSERFIGAVVRAVRWLVHGDARIRRLLACRTLDEQRRLYTAEWDTRRWRWLFALLLNRWAFDRTYDPAFFAQVENPSFSRHFHAMVERGLTTLPVATNYFLHEMLTGRYPERDDGLPPYLTAAGAAAVRDRLARLALVDGGLTTHLRTLPAASVDAFALSNVGEWMDADGLDALFGEVVRTARPGARLVYRNFVGWTEIPAHWCQHVRERAAEGERLSAQDRSLLQRRIVVCDVVPTTVPVASPDPALAGAAS